VVKRNCEAVDQTLDNLYRIPVPALATSAEAVRRELPADAPAFVRSFIAPVMEGKGELLPVSAMPIDGTFPTGTAKYEKRNIAQAVPAWEADMCIECGNCSFVCPHSCIRAKFYPSSALEGAPESFKHAKLRGRGFPDHRYTLHISLEDCTGCGLCVDACPVELKDSGKRAINLTAKEPLLEPEAANGAFFAKLPNNDRATVNFGNVRGVQFLEPLFEFSGACSGCGETPYLKVLSQLYGDRLMIANATGCSSIYGGNLPTTPWTKNDEGRGPAWPTAS
jgi:pyruvate-ferredoxin/flavodoxin oxidoreductase